MLKPLWRFIARIIVSVIFRKKKTSNESSNKQASTVANNDNSLNEESLTNLNEKGENDNGANFGTRI